MRDSHLLASALSESQINVVIAGMFLLALIVVLSPVLLARVHRNSQWTSVDAVGRQAPTSFFQLPFVTWFLIHLYVALLGILAVVGLGLAGAIDKTTIAALLSGLFGYVLGNAAHAAPGSSGGTRRAAPEMDVSG
jgi:hypothetical protein